MVFTVTPLLPAWPTWVTFCAPLAALFLFLFIRMALWKPTYPHFPGPPSIPFLGHATIMPNDHHGKVFSEWGRTFGELYSLE